MRRGLRPLVRATWQWDTVSYLRFLCSVLDCWGSDGTPERRVRDAGPLSSTVVSVGSVAASTGLPPPTTPQGRARAEQLRLDAHIDAAYANDRNRGAVVVDLGEGGGVDGEYDASHGQSAYHVSPNAEETLEEAWALRKTARWVPAGSRDVVLVGCWSICALL